MGPRLRRCGAMTLRCRPRAGGVPYAAARRCGRASDNRNLGGYGSPPARGRQRLGLCQGRLSMLDPRFRGDERNSWLCRALFGTACLMFGHTVAAAEPIEDFYRGKTITTYVGTGIGAGAVSAYPMALAPVIRKYIPGNPNVVVSHMPGAGGIKAATFIESIGPQDGTPWGFITRGFMLAPLLKLPQANFQPARFNWIGSPSRTVSIGAVWNTSTPVRTIQDAMQREVVVGATSIAQDTGIFPRALNRV